MIIFIIKPNEFKSCIKAVMFLSFFGVVGPLGGVKRRAGDKNNFNDKTFLNLVLLTETCLYISSVLND